MNWRAVLAIVRKDLKVVLQNKSVLLPIVIIPLVFFVVLPWMAAFAPQLVNIAGVSINELNDLIGRMPAGFQASLAGLNLDQKVIVFFLVYMLAPLFLIIPLMVASVIAADSFAGERERKTLEALLYTPTTDRELFMGKLLSAWLPAIGAALIGFLLYAIMANAAGWSVMGRVFFPNLMWLVLLLWVVPAVADLGLGNGPGLYPGPGVPGCLPVGKRRCGSGPSTSIRSGFRHPVFSVPVVLLLGLGVWLLNGILLWLGRRVFQRSRLIARV